MPSIPSTIPEIGSTSEPLRPNPSFDPRHAGSLTTRDYFVFSRIDGATSIRDLVLMVGLPADETIAIVQKLRELGAVLLVGEQEPGLAHRLAATAQDDAALLVGEQEPGLAHRLAATAQDDAEPSLASPEITGAWTLRDRDPQAGAAAAPEEALTDDERRAFAEQVDLEDEVKRRILAMRRVVATSDYFQILDVDEHADKRTIKRVYFKLSKEFHPDRFYGMQLGSFGAFLSEVFSAIDQAYSVLSSPKRREAYEASRRGEHRSQSREEHAEELFRLGIEKEARNDFAEALKLFEASLRVAPTLATLRRAAACALRAEKLELAQRYAERAAGERAEDPSIQRLLAKVCRARGDLARAEQILVHALKSKAASDVLASELAADLESVRRTQTGSTS